jgi:RNA polymerase sigma-70 factor (ECF subfamily)
MQGSQDPQDAWPELMAAAQDGDRAAYAQLLTELIPHLRALLAARLESALDLEQAVSQALLSIHQRRHTYDPRRPIEPWLAAISKAAARRPKPAAHPWPFLRSEQALGPMPAPVMLTFVFRQRS